MSDREIRVRLTGDEARWLKALEENTGRNGADLVRIWVRRERDALEKALRAELERLAVARGRVSEALGGPGRHE